MIGSLVTHLYRCRQTAACRRLPSTPACTRIPVAQGNSPWGRLLAPAGRCARPQSRPPKAFSSRRRKNHSTPNFSPPCSPDLHPPDYGTRCVLKARAQAMSHTNMESLKSTITREWRALSYTKIWRSWARFRSRLERVVAVDSTCIG